MRSFLYYFISSICSPSLPSFLNLLSLSSFLTTYLPFLLLPSSLYPFLPSFLSTRLSSFLPPCLPLLLPSFIPSFLSSLLPSHSYVPVRLLNTSTCTFIQGRLFLYSETQSYCLGVKQLQLPVNCPFGSPGVTNYQTDGHDAFLQSGWSTKFLTPTASAGPRTCQQLPLASSVSQLVLRGEAAVSVRL